MTDRPHSIENPNEPGESAPQWDAEILRYALEEARKTSPDSFLTTTADIDPSPDYWTDEMSFSTWVVAEYAGKVVGIAAAKRPDPKEDHEDQATARYIESVWIAPDHRRQGLGHRLIMYLLEAERQKNQSVRHFLLWVFKTNKTAIRVYEHMGFLRTATEKKHGEVIEIKYHLDLSSIDHSALRTTVNEVARHQERRQPKVTYRILGAKDSM